MDKVSEQINIYEDDFGNYIYILLFDGIPIKGMMSDEYLDPDDVEDGITEPKPYTLELSIHQAQHIVKNMEPIDHYYV